MKSTTFVFLVAALLAQFTNATLLFLNSNWTGISTTQPLVIRWRGNGTPVNISLNHGPEDNMMFVRNITVNNSKTQMSWRPSEMDTSGNYSLTIHQSGVSASSPRFEFIGVLSRVPATLSVVVTMSSTATAQTSLLPSEMPKIVIVGREVVDEVASVATPAPAPLPHVQHGVAFIRAFNGTGSNGTAGATLSSGMAVQGGAGGLRTNFVALGFVCLLAFTMAM